MTTFLTPNEILNLSMPDNDSGADTVRGYLIALLARLWREGEGFSGKRPFGTSGWWSELAIPLVKAEVVVGTFTDEGFLDDYDIEALDAVIAEAINALGSGSDRA